MKYCTFGNLEKASKNICNEAGIYNQLFSKIKEYGSRFLILLRRQVLLGVDILRKQSHGGVL